LNKELNILMLCAGIIH